MKFTDNQRKDIVNALKLAKPMIWTGRRNSKPGCEFICKSLDVLCERDLITSETKFLIKDEIIHPRINYRFVLEAWMTLDACIPQEQMTPPRVQRYRISWLNKLIEEFSD